ncbi:MAG: GGDEF domain-containing protein [Pseudolabrys sp.]
MTADKPQPPTSGGPALGPAALLRAEVERLKGELIKAEWKIAELEARADVDPMVEILNRRGFERELTRSIAYVKRYKAQAALVYIDLDGFKAVNDKYGHAVGDALLKAVAAQLTTRVRASDIVARLGGDEFAVLLWNLDTERAFAKAQDLEAAIAEVGVAAGSARVSVDASAGVVALNADTTPDIIREAADKAMYTRKKERRGHGP